MGMFGETKGDLMKPGLTRGDLEAALEKRKQGLDESEPNPFGDVFSETSSGRTAVKRKLETDSTAAADTPAIEPDDANDDDNADENQAPVYEKTERLQFGGSVASVVDVPYTMELNPKGSYSVDFMVKPDPKMAKESTYQCILAC